MEQTAEALFFVQGSRGSITVSWATMPFGNRIGFSTANLDVQGLCLPPFGVYAVHMLCEGSRYPGVANLGIVPTVRHDTHPLLEVHLIKSETDKSSFPP